MPDFTKTPPRSRPAHAVIGGTSNPRTIITEDGREVEIADVDPVMSLSEELLPWERHPTESDRAWAAFKIYRDTPISERTIVGTARQLNGPNAAVPPTIQRWVKIYRWRDRVIAYDNWVAKKEANALLQARIAAHRAIAELGDQLRSKAAEALAALDPIVIKEVKDPETGEITVETRSRLTPNEITRLADTALKLMKAGLRMEDVNPDGTLRDDVAGGPLAGGVTVNIFNDQRGLLEKAREVLEAREKQAAMAEIIEGEIAAPAIEVTNSSLPSGSKGAGGVHRDGS